MFWRWDRVGEVNVTEVGQIYVWKETPVYIFRMRGSWWTEVNSASQRFHVYFLKRSGIKVCIKKMSNTDPLSSLLKRKWWELPVHEVTCEVPCPVPGMCGILDNCSVNIVVITVTWGLNCEGEGCGRVVFSPVSNWEGDGTTYRRGSQEGGLCFLAPDGFPFVLKCSSFILYPELSIAFT